MANQKKTQRAPNSPKGQGVVAVGTKISRDELADLQRLVDISGKTQARILREAMRFYVGVRLAGFAVEEDATVELAQAAHEMRHARPIFKAMGKQFETLMGFNPMESGDRFAEQMVADLKANPQAVAEIVREIQVAQAREATPPITTGGAAA